MCHQTHKGTRNAALGHFVVPDENFDEEDEGDLGDDEIPMPTSTTAA